MGFDDVTRGYKPKSSFVRLECLNCDKGSDSVRSRHPPWYNGFKEVPLCDGCAYLLMPTSAALIAQRITALEERDAREMNGYCD